MSYILDALKKADAERERDAAAVPDLNAQADAAARSARASARNPLWPLLAMTAIALALAWRWFSAEPSEAAPSPAQVQASAAVPAGPKAAIERPAQAAPTPAAAAPIVAAPGMAAVTPAPAPRPSQPPRAVAVAPPVAAPVTAPAPAPKLAAAASAATEPRLYAMAELPADLRSQLPALAVGGSVYSPNAASRIVILNGQVFREGDKPIDGLTIEQIRLKSTVLSFRGLRFELKH